MPPRRSVRASSSSRLFDGSSEAGGPLDALPADAMHAPIGHGMSPGPAKYSSTYGSPPTILPTRRNVAQQRYQFSSALNHVVDAVEQDNENDARERAEREAELWRQQQQENQPPEQPPQQQPQTQRQRSPAAASATGSQSGQRAAAREASRQSQDTVESVELVHERGDEEEAPATGRTRRSTRQSRSDLLAAKHTRPYTDSPFLLHRTSCIDDSRSGTASSCSSTVHAASTTNERPSSAGLCRRRAHLCRVTDPHAGAANPHDWSCLQGGQHRPEHYQLYPSQVDSPR